MSESAKVLYLPGSAYERVLVTRMQQGDADAFQETYAALAPLVLRVLRRMMGNAALAEDVLQETFVTCFRRISTFRGEAQLSSWLTSVAMNRARNTLRGEARRRVGEQRGADSPDPAPTPDHALASAQAHAELERALSSLPEEVRGALVLAAEGFTAAEIASMLGAPRGTILSRIFRGRVTLGRMLRGAATALPRRGTRG